MFLQANSERLHCHVALCNARGIQANYIANDFLDTRVTEQLLQPMVHGKAPETYGEGIR
jgi:hypothetical protein